jgi:phosphoribosylformylglycinamidine cyclo-ligase
MGIGMVLAVKPQDKEKTMAAIEAAGEKAYEIGRIVAGDKGVDLV